jgi:hypothetical protein
MRDHVIKIQGGREFLLGSRNSRAQELEKVASGKHVKGAEQRRQR